MDLPGLPLGIYVRIVALISLLLGLNDASRLLGINMGDTSPLTELGAAGFTLLAIFALARLFAAVGLWIRASWGAVLLVGSTGIELLLYVTGNPDVRMSVIGFVVRLVLLLALLAIFLLGLRLNRLRAAD